MVDNSTIIYQYPLISWLPFYYNIYIYNYYIYISFMLKSPFFGTPPEFMQNKTRPTALRGIAQNFMVFGAVDITLGAVPSRPIKWWLMVNHRKSWDLYIYIYTLYIYILYIHIQYTYTVSIYDIRIIYIYKIHIKYTHIYNIHKIYIEYI